MDPDHSHQHDLLLLPGGKFTSGLEHEQLLIHYQMYNALGGLGGSGQVDSTVAANATVALLSATAATALFVVGPLFSFVGPRITFLLGGWTYALYSGSLLNFNRVYCTQQRHTLS